LRSGSADDGDQRQRQGEAMLLHSKFLPASYDLVTSHASKG
jgi:hypothetical protein